MAPFQNGVKVRVRCKAAQGMDVPTVVDLGAIEDPRHKGEADEDSASAPASARENLPTLGDRAFFTRIAAEGVSELMQARPVTSNDASLVHKQLLDLFHRCEDGGLSAPTFCGDYVPVVECDGEPGPHLRPKAGSDLVEGDVLVAPMHGNKTCSPGRAGVLPPPLAEWVSSFPVWGPEPPTRRTGVHR
jgi:hypothetical protein